jgi:hypothetical protein
MQASEVPRAVAQAMSTASSLDLTADDAIVLHDSNKLTLRLLPCDVLARVAPEWGQVFGDEVLATAILDRLHGALTTMTRLGPPSPAWELHLAKWIRPRR